MIAMIAVCSFLHGRLMLAIRTAAAWYKNHLTINLRVSRDRVPEIVLLTNDQGNVARAREIGVVACSSISPFLCPNDSGGIH